MDTFCWNFSEGDQGKLGEVGALRSPLEVTATHTIKLSGQAEAEASGGVGEACTDELCNVETKTLKVELAKNNILHLTAGCQIGKSK